MPSKARRAWAVYNEALVRRAEILFSFGVLDRWDGELESMKDGKVGAPYRYPDSFIGCLVDIKHFLKVGYRQVQGIVRALSKSVKRLKAPDYTTLWERGSRLRPSIDGRVGDCGGGVVLAVDATGVKVHDRGEWMRELYGPKEEEGIPEAPPISRYKGEEDR